MLKIVTDHEIFGMNNFLSNCTFIHHNEGSICLNHDLPD